MKQQYDFYKYGLKVAEEALFDGRNDIKKLEKEIEQRYGAKARELFCLGYNVYLKEAKAATKYDFEFVESVEQEEYIEDKIRRSIKEEKANKTVL